MKIHEYQAKEIFRAYDIPTPEGRACFTAADADAAIRELDGDIKVVKAQIHAGGRGKGGGVKVAKGAEEASARAKEILGMRLVTHQTGADGQTVRRLLIEQGVNIAAELYMALVVDRVKQQVVLMASAEGGMDIEEVAAERPEKILKMWINPAQGVDAKEAEGVLTAIGVPAPALAEGVALVENLYRLFIAADAALVEINPLVITADERLIALDGKMNFDESAEFRHPEWDALRDIDEEDEAETEAKKHDLSYIALDGDIGCMVNGAGLAMATMDIIKLYGGEPANFLDVGGGATKEKVAAAFKLMLSNKNIRAILINIFGGIMRCDVIAEGVTAALKEAPLTVPLVVRLEGTNVEQGREILEKSGQAVITATTMADAAEKVVAAAAGK